MFENSFEQFRRIFKIIFSLKKLYTLTTLLFVLCITICAINKLFSRQSGKFKRISSQVLDNYYFGYELKPNICKEKEFKFILIVTSYVNNVELRSAHRQAFPKEYLDKQDAARIFVLAKIPDSDIMIKQNAIVNENKRFGDILQGKFIEHYHNLTYKHIMGLNWTSLNCKTNYIVKVDDDIVFNFDFVLHLLQEPKYQSIPDLMLGHVLSNKASRNKFNKWYVSKNEYLDSKYPSYLSGWFYILTPKVARNIVNNTPYYRFFWIDDVFITGIIRSHLGITLYEIGLKYISSSVSNMFCCTELLSKNISCDYKIGPNGNHNNAIIDYNKAYNACKMSSNCRKASYVNFDKCKATLRYDIGSPELRRVNL